MVAMRGADLTRGVVGTGVVVGVVVEYVHYYIVKQLNEWVD